MKAQMEHNFDEMEATKQSMQEIVSEHSQQLSVEPLLDRLSAASAEPPSQPHSHCACHHHGESNENEAELFYQGIVAVS